MPAKPIALGPFLATLGEQLDALTAAELRAAVLAHASTLEPSERRALLRSFAGEPGDVPALSGDTLLDDITDLVDRLQAGEFFQDWGWDDDLHDERAWGDESWAAEMDALFTLQAMGRRPACRSRSVVRERDCCTLGRVLAAPAVGGSTGLLRAENAVLRAENEQLRGEVEALRRASKRQAAPFSKGNPKQDPQRSGRKPGVGLRPLPATVRYGCAHGAESMTTHIYGMKHSHPALAARMALELTGLPFQAHDVLPGLHGIIVRAKGFPAWTVPALEIDGRKVQGTRAIARELDRLAPDAGIFPRDPEQRHAVEEAESFGHDELQPIARRVFRWAGERDNAVRAWMAKEVVGAPVPNLVGYAFKPVMFFFGRVISKADDAQVRTDLARLPELMDHADALVADDTIGGEAPNAADLQILTSLRLLMAHEDLRPAIAPRPCGQAALRLIPDYPRSGPDALAPVPAALPPEWLPPIPVGGAC